MYCYRDGVYISKGYDPSTHFETTVDDVLDMYQRITGKVGAPRICYESSSSTASIRALVLWYLLLAGLLSPVLLSVCKIAQLTDLFRQALDLDSQDPMVAQTEV